MPSSSVRVVDGSFAFEAGVDSARNPTVISDSNPNGLPRNGLAWGDNLTVRGGGILQRTGFAALTRLLTEGLYQGGWLYEPLFLESPYLILSVSGQIYKVLLDAPFTITNLSVQFGLFNPPAIDFAHFVQGERFVVIQAGDYQITNPPTLPLFWDGNILRRSNGITGNISGPNINELPAAGPMCFYAGRIWYAQGRIYTAGDIDGSTVSGTIAYQYTDSILKVTENPLALGGDGFRVPDSSGDIRALFYTANLNSVLGQGPLYVSTRRQIYALDVPVTRTAWSTTTTNNMPLQTVVQRRYGTVGDRCNVAVNGDVYYQTMEPAIRSLLVSVRNDLQPGNVPLSRKENRALAFNDRALMRFATGINFDNRLLQAILPAQGERGVVFKGIAPLDFDVVDPLVVGAPPSPPSWEGMLEGLDVLQLFEGDFGGRERAFAVIESRIDQGIEIWEITKTEKVDNQFAIPPAVGLAESRVQWYFETPAYTFNKPFDLKDLDGLQLWVDRISGTIEMTVEYREDVNPCWHFWHRTQFCAARSSCESVIEPVCYPVGPTFCEGMKFPLTFPKPQDTECSSMNQRPTTRAFQFQLRITIRGWCRIRAILLWGLPVDQSPFEGLTC